MRYCPICRYVVVAAVVLTPSTLLLGLYLGGQANASLSLNTEKAPFASFSAQGISEHRERKLDCNND